MKEIKLNRNPKSLAAIDANLQKMDKQVALIDEHTAAVGKKVKSAMTGLVADLKTELCNEIMSLLLKKGADIQKRTNDNKTPLSIANEHDAKELAQFLKENGA
jgi:ankyrin repeat protein